MRETDAGSGGFDTKKASDPPQIISRQRKMWKIHLGPFGERAAAQAGDRNLCASHLGVVEGAAAAERVVGAMVVDLQCRRVIRAQRDACILECSRERRTAQ